MIIHIQNTNDERVLVVYEPKKTVSFFRPLFGIELALSDDDLLHRVRTRVKKWDRST